MHYLKRIMLTIALAVSTTMLVPTGPAQAGPGWVEICFPVVVMTEDGPRITEICPRKIYLHEKIEIPCPPDCGPYFDIWDPKVDPEWQIKFNEGWLANIATLAQSHLTEDPKLAEELRREATEGLYNMAKMAEGFDVELHDAAWIDFETGKLYESELLLEVGENLVAGHRLMTKAMEDPEAIAPAMEAYDKALAGFGY